MSNYSTNRDGISTIRLDPIYKEENLTNLFSQIKSHITMHHHLLNYATKFYSKRNKGLNSSHSISVGTHCSITSIFPIVLFLSIRKSRCDDELSSEYFSHSRVYYYHNLYYDHKTKNTAESKSIMSPSTTVTSSTDLHEYP